MPVALTTRWLAIARRIPSAWLLGAQLLAVLLYPALDDTASGRAALGMFGMAVLGLALWVVQRSPLGTWLALLLAIPAVVFSLAGALLDRSALLTTAQLLESLLYFYTAGALIAYMLQDHKVTRDELFAAGATFTLLAWAFAFAFSVCQQWYPGSFQGTGGGGAAHLDGVALSELQLAVRGGLERRRAAASTGTRIGHAGAVFRRDVRGFGGFATGRIDHAEARLKMNAR